MADLFRLSAELRGHDQDVRGVCVGVGGGVVTGSRDRTARLWESEGQNAFTQTALYAGATDFVSAVAFVPPSDAFPEGLVATGSKDKRIRVYAGRSTEPLFVLEGHTDNVSCLAVGLDGTLVSGSWDHTVRVWRGQECVHVLKGHSQAVWAVLSLGGSRVVSAGADKTIRMWDNGACTKTIPGHQDAVRGLAALPGGGFVSCGNDAVLRVWSSDGSAQGDLHGHTAFVYGVCVVEGSGGEFASCGEDRCLRIWRNGECVQSIAHPAPSVWCVAALPNGDLVTGSSDGVARVFTRSSERAAPAEVLERYDLEVKAQTIPSNQLGDINKEDIPGPEALARPGNREGQTKLVRQPNGKIECYQWSAGQWICMGEVLDAVGSSQKQLYQGKEYDYVFDIDIGAGQNLKLPFNVTENPYMAAHNFLERHEISQDHLEQVAQFIIKNTQGHTLGQQGGTGYVDPFTGGGAYTTFGEATQPGRGGGFASGGAADPFTGSGAYTSGSGGVGSAPAGPRPFVDPFTGSGAYVSGDFEQQRAAAASSGSRAPQAPAPTGNTGSSQYYPVNTYLTFDTSNVPGLVKKLKEFNDGVPDDVKASNSELDEVAVMAVSFKDSHLTTLSKLLAWPSDRLFPALDVLRLVVLQRDGARALAAFEPQLNLISKLLDITNNKSNPAADLFLSTRFFANAFVHAETRNVVTKRANDILTSVTGLVENANRNIPLASVTVMLNFSVVLRGRGADPEARLQLLSGLANVLGTQADPEVIFRALVGLGNLVTGDEESLANARVLEVKPLVMTHAASTTQKVKECATALGRML
eukprot:comp20625_c0_seq1/m.26668 comp20625_c0_seq1/g.26668  ORF comp20625_c0_seq1/g.26668 comp20625_c0_seq1/m.26668 type:complete len:810 (-) comp20625_c0_seq1:123-2552(-)